MTKDEALRLALEALEECEIPWPNTRDVKVTEAITAIKAALEANEFNPDWDTQAVLTEEIQRMAKRVEELEAQRTWVGLTNDEMDNFVKAAWGQGVTAADFIRAIEAKLKKENT